MAENEVLGGADAERLELALEEALLVPVALCEEKQNRRENDGGALIASGYSLLEHLQ